MTLKVDACGGGAFPYCQFAFALGLTGGFAGGLGGGLGTGVSKAPEYAALGTGGGGGLGCTPGRVRSPC